MLSSLLVCLYLFIVLMASALPSGVNEVFGDLVTSVIPVGSFPQALVFNPSNNNLYVANRDSGMVSVIETANNTVIKNIAVGASPQALVFSPFNNNTYVTNRDSLRMLLSAASQNNCSSTQSTTISTLQM
jgi:YVTN family beta-propeller protein